MQKGNRHSTFAARLKRLLSSGGSFIVCLSVLSASYIAKIQSYSDTLLDLRFFSSAFVTNDYCVRQHPPIYILYLFLRRAFCGS